MYCHCMYLKTLHCNQRRYPNEVAREICQVLLSYTKLKGRRTEMPKPLFLICNWTIGYGGLHIANTLGKSLYAISPAVVWSTFLFRLFSGSSPHTLFQVARYLVNTRSVWFHEQRDNSVKLLNVCNYCYGLANLRPVCQRRTSFVSALGRGGCDSINNWTFRSCRKMLIGYVRAISLLLVELLQGGRIVLEWIRLVVSNCAVSC